MRSLKFTYLLIILASFVFISCENEPLTGTFTDETGGGNGSGSGNGSGTSTGDYYPRAIGNTWTYSVNTGGSETLVMNNTSVHNSQTYYNFAEQNGSGSIRKSAASYFMYIAANVETPSYIISSSPIEIKFLQDDAAVGTSWENQRTVDYIYTSVGGSPDIPNATVNVNYQYTIEGVGLIKVVNGTTYENVIHVSHILDSGLGVPDTTGDYYFAKDIGLIEYRIDNTTKKLNSYSLN